MLSVPLGGVLKLSNYPLELFIHLSSYCVESRIVSYYRQHRLGVYRCDDRFPGFVSFIYDDIAGKKQSDVDLLLQSLVCEAGLQAPRIT